MDIDADALARLFEPRRRPVAAPLSPEPAEVLPPVEPPAPPSAGPRCPTCGKAVDAKLRCWKCVDRACRLCGRPTGSAFIEHCDRCGLTV